MSFSSSLEKGLPTPPPAEKRSNRSRPVVLGAFGILATIWLLRLGLVDFRLGSHSSCRTDGLSKDNFVAQMYYAEMETYDSALLERYCSSASWNTSLVVDCDGISGEIDNQRQTLLACIQDAMDAKSGIIIPKISSVVGDYGGRLEGDIYSSFNRGLLVSRLNTACPRMTVYESTEAAFRPEREIRRPLQAMDRLKEDEPQGVNGKPNLDSLLAFPDSVYILAYSALYTLTKSYSLQLSTSNASSIAPYLGVRLENPPHAQQLPTWPVQQMHSQHLLHASRRPSSATQLQDDLGIQNHLPLAAALRFPVVYVASASPTTVQQMRQEAGSLVPEIGIVTIEDLLSETQMEELGRWPEERAAMVDYLVLEHAAYVTG